MQHSRILAHVLNFNSKTKQTTHTMLICQNRSGVRVQLVFNEFISTSRLVHAIVNKLRGLFRK